MKKEKLFERIMSKPAKKDITYEEAKKFLLDQGYELIQGSGSRVRFYNKKTKRVLTLHKPHPGNELKEYQVKQIQAETETVLNR